MNIEFAAALRSASPYINAHRDRTCVVLIPGEAAHGRDLSPLLHDLAVAHSLGLRLVLVPGMRPQVDERLAARGIAAPIVDDYRVTPAEALPIVTEAAGSLRCEIEALLSTALASTPLGGTRLRVVSGNMVTARPVGVRGGVDLQHTGLVRRIDSDTLVDHLHSNRIVVLPALGYSPTGEVFNLRAEDVALAAANALSAHKLVCFVDRRVDRAEYTLEQAEQQIGNQSWAGWSLAACREGVARVHILDCNDDGALLRELYTRDGAGIMVTGEDYDQLRGAGIDDIGGILGLIGPLEAEGILVPRSREQLELEIERFRVLLRDGAIIGCCALFPHATEHSAELACLAVDPAYRHDGRAAKLLAHAEQEARAAGMRRLFVLTTHAAHWFIEHGFQAADPDALPGERRDYYNYRRNSQVLLKALEADTAGS